jgi:hypothetical protein
MEKGKLVLNITSKKIVLHSIFFLLIIIASPLRAEWKTSYIIDQGPKMGVCPTMQIKTENSTNTSILHLTYYDEESKTLKYAKIQNGVVESMWGMDYSGNAGKYNSIGVDSQGSVHVAYYDEKNGNLNYIHYSISGFSKTTIDGENGEGIIVGLYASIAIDNKSNPHISYYDETNGDLKYIYFSGESWEPPVVIDSEKDVGQYTSIVLDDDNLPHIAYYDASNGNLKYAYFANAEWKIEIVDSGNNVGSYASLALDNKGQPHIAYYDRTFKKLKYATFDGKRWNEKFVISKFGDFFEDFGSYCSLKLDTNNNPHISYFNETLHQIKYAILDGIWWKIEIPYIMSYSGPFNSLVLDEYDNPYIAAFTSIAIPDFIIAD